LPYQNYLVDKQEFVCIFDIMNHILKKAKGILFDLDGVVYLEETPYPGAVDSIIKIKQQDRKCRFVTNTTTKCLDTLYKKIVRLNLPIEKEELITPPVLAANYLRKKTIEKVYLVMGEDTKSDFSEFTEDDENPEYIVIGNYDDKWDYPLLNKLFHMIINGAKLLALHKGKYWQTGEGLKLDIGCFITGLEYAADIKAEIIGKPEPLFFKTALESIGLPAEEVVMIGDDINSDIGGAQAAGIHGVLVKTGKYREDLVAKSSVIPYMIIDSVATLDRYL